MLAGALKVLMNGLPSYEEPPNDQVYWKRLSIAEPYLNLIKTLLFINMEIGTMVKDLLLEVAAW